MWPSRKKSNPQIHKSFSKNFSFKDIHTLYSDPSPSPSPSPNPSPVKPNSNASVFHRVRRATAVLRAFSTSAPRPPQLTPPPPQHAEEYRSEPSISIPGAEKRIVVYLTSLRVVRSTFEACRSVQSILRGFRVTIDERDLSMDSTFMEELQRILKIREKTKLTLPRVFIGGRYIGGAEEVRQMNETGELKRLVEGLPAAEPGVCEECGGYNFVLCEECSGSHKLFTEKSNGFRSCNACNENGLIRCPSCSCGPL